MVEIFLGTHEPKLDEKGRLILPAKFRDALAGGLVLTRGQERCIYAFPTREFEELQEQLQTAPISNRDSRHYMRFFLSAAYPQPLDKQGRITIPAALRTYAGLDREIVVIGVGSRIEVWSASAWNAYLEAEEEGYAAVAEEVIPGIL